MIVRDDLVLFSDELASRFDATSANVISDLAVKMAGFDLPICVKAMADLRAAMPSHHRMVDGLRLLAIARRMHLERHVEIVGERKKETCRGIPFDASRPAPDRRTPDQRKWEEHRAKSKAWVESLDESTRDQLLELALQHWPEGDERAFFRSRGVNSCVVRDEMIRVSQKRGDDPDPQNKTAAA